MELKLSLSLSWYHPLSITRMKFVEKFGGFCFLFICHNFLRSYSNGAITTPASKINIFHPAGPIIGSLCSCKYLLNLRHSRSWKKYNHCECKYIFLGWYSWNRRSSSCHRTMTIIDHISHRSYSILRENSNTLRSLSLLTRTVTFYCIAVWCCITLMNNSFCCSHRHTSCFMGTFFYFT